MKLLNESEIKQVSGGEFTVTILDPLFSVDVVSDANTVKTAANASFGSGFHGAVTLPFYFPKPVFF